MNMDKGNTIELDITSLGGQGDGIGEHDGQRVFVPGTVEGDRVQARITGKTSDALRASVTKVIQEGPGRQTPPCPYFGECGGCAVQHLSPEKESDWKRGIVQDALSRRGLGDVAVSETRMINTASRRRTRWSAIRAGGRLLVGYQQKGSNRVVDIDHCAVLDPALNEILPAVKSLVETLRIPKKGLGISATLTDTGVDLTIEAPGEPDMPLRMRLGEFAQAHDLPRISWGNRDPEVLLMIREPVVSFGGAGVVAPAGGFLQASAAAEKVLSDLVFGHLAGAKKIADLYAGVGTFALSLADSGATVQAFDGNDAAIAALQTAVNRSAGRLTVSAEVRDLDRRPLQGKELKKLDAVVLDPPRAGAQTVCTELAASGIGKIAYVSCNPGTFARDARMLVDGGYDLKNVIPVNQFAWSPHVELVAEFVRS